jgi:nucleoside-triphosphatase THEP1
MAKVYILTGPVQSGKTTELLEWANERLDICGFLMPDIDGRRHYYQIEKQLSIPFETDADTVDEIIKIGRFTFYLDTFAVAKSWLTHAHLMGKNWIIIDEIGKLELNNQGFEPELSIFLQNMKQISDDKSLIIVVREGLLDQVVRHYNLEDAIIIHSLDGLISIIH